MKWTDPAKTGLALPVANPGTTFTWIINLIVAVLKPIMAVLTPMLRDELSGVLTDFYKKAASSASPWDDFLAEFLLKILGIPIPTE